MGSQRIRHDWVTSLSLSANLLFIVNSFPRYFFCLHSSWKESWGMGLEFSWAVSFKAVPQPLSWLPMVTVPGLLSPCRILENGLQLGTFPFLHRWPKRIVKCSPSWSNFPFIGLTRRHRCQHVWIYWKAGMICHKNYDMWEGREYICRSTVMSDSLWPHEP